MPEVTSGQEPDKEAAEGAGSASSGSESVKTASAKSGANEFVSQRALVVEDARILRKMLVKILQERGFSIEEAGNGHEALALLRRSKSLNQPFDLIITDLMMPEMDGWTLIDQLLEKKYIPNIPVIVITATASVDSVKRCARAGVRHYIVKPFETMRVVDTVRKALARGNEVKNTGENSTAGSSADSGAAGADGSRDQADLSAPQQEQQNQAEGPDVASASAGG